ncbi:MAG: hypothetical protein H7Z43_15795 [Clostridia bacterium]|nr:hypothetical protein [Deltaproteobacteria bacterium]
MTAYDFNRDCRCLSIDRTELDQQLMGAGLAHGLSSDILARHAHLFASVPVFVDREALTQMNATVRAIEEVVATPAYREAVLADAPDIAKHDPGPLGVFFGYDFHLGHDGPQLIEVNTNAGGALLNAFLARSQRHCCDEMEGLTTSPHRLGELETAFSAMFSHEWCLAGHRGEPRRIAIVDDTPHEQFLFPELLLFCELFRKRGIEAEIVDARELVFDGKHLTHNGAAIDLVYNRLTDFYFTEHQALHDAYKARAAVITPHPRAHALYADKHNLVLLSDLSFLALLNLSPGVVATLSAGIPKTIVVDPADADRLWSMRKTYFFKPMHGFGSKATYRGDKLTRRVFDEILTKPYVAQHLVPPTKRTIAIEGRDVPLKLDIRAYVYAQTTQLFASRLYSGQTTNFRTQGGGFAPVFTQKSALDSRFGDPV